ncbi:MAG TPA: FHA domain-containing protein [Candidatus Angelobacter sp.]
MQVELHLLGTAERWRIATSRARIGRDPGCEAPLAADRYPMVSREHAILTIENGRLRLMDNHSTNGTFVNGVRTSNAMLTKLDRFRLGHDGPEFEIQVIEDQPAASASTLVERDAANIKTQMGKADAEATPTRIATSKEPQSDGSAVLNAAKKIEPAQREEPDGSAREAADSGLFHEFELTQEEEEMIEQKLNSLRNLAYLLVAMVAVLLGVIFYQNQQIDKNRAELNDMRRQAQSAVAQFTPTLDQRLGALDKRLTGFDQRLNQVDAKMKDTEDQFMTRLNDEIPRMLDKYVDHKMKQLSQVAPK